jgi:DNA replication protein DnaC
MKKEIKIILYYYLKLLRLKKICDFISYIIDKDFNKYECKQCGKVVYRKSKKTWIASYCERKQKKVHLMKIIKRKNTKGN